MAKKTLITQKTQKQMTRSRNRYKNNQGAKYISFEEFEQLFEEFQKEQEQQHQQPHQTGEKVANDPIRPNYYRSKFGVELMQLMKERFGIAAFIGFCLCNAFKYMFRCRFKNETIVEDIRKAHFYLTALVQEFDKCEDKEK